MRLFSLHFYETQCYGRLAVIVNFPWCFACFAYRKLDFYYIACVLCDTNWSNLKQLKETEIILHLYWMNKNFFVRWGFICYTFAGWKVRCAEYFPHSTYFEGIHSSAVRNSASPQIHKTPENGGVNSSIAGPNAFSVPSNGNVEKLQALKNLAIH